MDTKEAIDERHSVRKYFEKSLTVQSREALLSEIKRCNMEGHLHFQLITDEPKAFSSMFSKAFAGCTNYIALIGENSDDLEEKCGYYGEQIVLFAQTIGLNTCWVGGSYKRVRRAMYVGKGEKLVAVIAVGYGKNDGKPHKSKPFEEVSLTPESECPYWYKAGVESALKAPTALNQQKFVFRYDKQTGLVMAVSGIGFFTAVDLGIAKYHFEVGSGKNKYIWME